MRDSRASLLSEYIFLFWYLCDEVIVCVVLLMIFILWDKKLRVNSYQTDVRFLHSTSLCFRACFVFGILNFNLPPFLTSLGLFSFVCFCGIPRERLLRASLATVVMLCGCFCVTQCFER